MRLQIAFLLVTITAVYGQYYIPSYEPSSSYHNLGYQSHSSEYQQPSQQISVAHPAVVENAIQESQYPAEYINKFYKDPRIAAALAKESWFTDQESPVINREAEKIPRDMIFRLFKNAGWIKRR